MLAESELRGKCALIRVIKILTLCDSTLEPLLQYCARLTWYWIVKFDLDGCRFVCMQSCLKVDFEEVEFFVRKPYLPLSKAQVRG